ncbi:MAG: hypothetical protein MHM6MM_004423 [Cercozoa sp. M6MM]
MMDPRSTSSLAKGLLEAPKGVVAQTVRELDGTEQTNLKRRPRRRQKKTQSLFRRHLESKPQRRVQLASAGELPVPEVPSLPTALSKPSNQSKKRLQRKRGGFFNEANALDEVLEARQKRLERQKQRKVRFSDEAKQSEAKRSETKQSEAKEQGAFASWQQLQQATRGDFGVLARERKIAGMSDEERAKFEWMSSVDDTEKQESQRLRSWQALQGNVLDTWRFDFDGNRVKEGETVDTSAGLHHHGDEAHLAGYTVRELCHLTRSVNHAQRAMALTTLASIFEQCRAALQRPDQIDLTDDLAFSESSDETRALGGIFAYQVRTKRQTSQQHETVVRKLVEAGIADHLAHALVNAAEQDRQVLILQAAASLRSECVLSNNALCAAVMRLALQHSQWPVQHAALHAILSSVSASAEAARHTVDFLPFLTPLALRERTDTRSTVLACQVLAIWSLCVQHEEKGTAAQAFVSNYALFGKHVFPRFDSSRNDIDYVAESLFLTALWSLQRQVLLACRYPAEAPCDWSQVARLCDLALHNLWQQHWPVDQATLAMTEAPVLDTCRAACRLAQAAVASFVAAFFDTAKTQTTPNEAQDVLPMHDPSETARVAFEIVNRWMRERMSVGATVLQNIELGGHFRSKKLAALGASAAALLPSMRHLSRCAFLESNCEMLRQAVHHIYAFKDVSHLREVAGFAMNVAIATSPLRDTCVSSIAVNHVSIDNWHPEALCALAALRLARALLPFSHRETLDDENRRKFARDFAINCRLQCRLELPSALRHHKMQHLQNQTEVTFDGQVRSLRHLLRVPVDSDAVREQLVFVLALIETDALDLRSHCTLPTHGSDFDVRQFKHGVRDVACLLLRACVEVFLHEECLFLDEDIGALLQRLWLIAGKHWRNVAQLFKPAQAFGENDIDQLSQCDPAWPLEPHDLCDYTTGEDKLTGDNDPRNMKRGFTLAEQLAAHYAADSYGDSLFRAVLRSVVCDTRPKSLREHLKSQYLQDIDI